MEAKKFFVQIKRGALKGASFVIFIISLNNHFIDIKVRKEGVFNNLCLCLFIVTRYLLQLSIDIAFDSYA